MKTINKMKIISASTLPQFIRFVNGYIKNRQVIAFSYNLKTTKISEYHIAAIITKEKSLAKNHR